MKWWILSILAGGILVWGSAEGSRNPEGLQFKSVNSRLESFGRPFDLNTLVLSTWDSAEDPPSPAPLTHQSSSSEENDLKMTSEGKDLGNLRALKTRLKRKRANRRGRMMKNFQSHQKSDISELCATSSSVRCGQRVLDSLSEKSDIHQKCRARDEFLDCLAEERVLCRSLVSLGLPPTLPHADVVKEMQEQIYTALWTSGRCTLL